MSKHTRQYKVLVGPHAGQTHEGYEIGARFTPDGETAWDKTGDRVWIPALETSFLCSSLPKDTNEAEDLLIPYDRFNVRIDKGDVLYVSRNKHDVVQARVLSYGKLFHHGCGWCERTLNMQDMNTGEKFKNSYPHACIRDNNLSPAR